LRVGREPVGAESGDVHAASLGGEDGEAVRHGRNAHVRSSSRIGGAVSVINIRQQLRHVNAFSKSISHSDIADSLL
jgi:hypothetical protein